MLVSKKWRRHLPVSVYPLSKSQYIMHHWLSLKIFLLHLIRLKFSYDKILKYYFAYSFTRYFSFRKFLSTGKYLLSNIFRNLKNGQVWHKMRGFLFASTPAMNGMRPIFKPAFGLATSAGYSKLFLPLWYMCMHRFICRSDMCRPPATLLRKSSAQAQQEGTWRAKKI